MSLIPRLGRCLGGGHGNPSSSLTWRIPWTEEPVRLQYIGSQRDTTEVTEHAHTRVYSFSEIEMIHNGFHKNKLCFLENLKTLKVFEQYLKSDSILQNELDAKKRERLMVWT